MKKLILVSVLCTVAVLSNTSLATVEIGGYTFDDNAFPDAALFLSGGPPSLSFPTTGDINSDLLLAVNPDLTKFIFGIPVVFVLGFLDNRLINDTGPDLVLFELVQPDTAAVAVRVDNGSGWTEPQLFLLTDTGYDVGEFNLNAVEIDLDIFGVPAMELIQNIWLSNISPLGDGDGPSSSINAVGALNSVIPEPATIFLLSFGGLGLLRRRKNA